MELYLERKNLKQHKGVSIGAFVADTTLVIP